MLSSALTLAIPSVAATEAKLTVAFGNEGGKCLTKYGIGVGKEKGRLKLITKSKGRRGGGGLRCKSELAELAPATSAAYGLLLLGGGIFAYTRSGSKGSLFGGLTGSVLMGSAYFLMQSPETKSIGDAIGFGSAFLFSSVFGIRLAASRKLFPAGPLLLLSVSVLTVFILAYMRDSLPA